MKKILPALSLLLVFGWCYSGCASKSPADISSSNVITGKLKLEYDDRSDESVIDEMDVFYGIWDRSKFSPATFVKHSVCLANHYLSGSAVRKNKPGAPSDPLYEVCFTITDQVETDRDSIITPGYYVSGGANPMKSSDMPGVLVAINIYKNKNHMAAVGLDTESLKGYVKIISSTKNSVDGEIDLTDGKGSVKGKFHLITR